MGKVKEEEDGAKRPRRVGVNYDKTANEKGMKWKGKGKPRRKERVKRGRKGREKKKGKRENKRANGQMDASISGQNTLPRSYRRFGQFFLNGIGHTDERTDIRTDTPSDRDVRTHLK